MFNGANSTTTLFHSILIKCYWKMLRNSLTIFDSPSNNRFRLCRSSPMIRNGNNYRETINHQRLVGNMFTRRLYSSVGNLTTEREERTSLVIANNKARTMNAIIGLQEEYYEYSSGCKPHNINELW